MGWRDRLAPASFKGVPFHVEDDAIEGGRRVVLHEYPMRDTPASEDLGRRARRTTVRGYVIGADYDSRLRAVVAACEAGGAGPLTLPNQGTQTVRCVFVGSATRREDGGYGTLDLEFLEAGAAPGPSIVGLILSALSAAAAAGFTATRSLGNGE